MKTLIQTLLATTATFALSANATVISVNISSDPNAEANFWASMGSVTATENFDGLGTGQVMGASGNQHDAYEAKSSSFSTSVGIFALTQVGQGGQNVYNNELMIESDATGEHGREQPVAADDFWLDSNDAKEVVWTLGGSIGSDAKALGFYIYDATDIAGSLSFTFADGTTGDIGVSSLSGLDNGNVRYVSVVSDQSLMNGTLTFSNTVGYDGWGMDKVTVGTLPEPGTLVLMGLGLFGLGMARRRTAKKA